MIRGFFKFRMDLSAIPILERVGISVLTSERNGRQREQGYHYDEEDLVDARVLPHVRRLGVI